MEDLFTFIQGRQKVINFSNKSQQNHEGSHSWCSCFFGGLPSSNQRPFSTDLRTSYWSPSTNACRADPSSERGGEVRSSILRWLNIWKLDENIDENGPDKLFVGLEIIGHDWQMEGLPKNSVPQKTDGLSSLSASKWWQFLCPISRISGNNQRAWLLTLQILQVRYALVSIYAHGQGLDSNCVTLVSTGCYCCHFLEMFGDDFASIL